MYFAREEHRYFIVSQMRSSHSSLFIALLTVVQSGSASELAFLTMARICSRSVSASLSPLAWMLATTVKGPEDGGSLPRWFGPRVMIAFVVIDVVGRCCDVYSLMEERGKEKIVVKLPLYQDSPPAPSRHFLVFNQPRSADHPLAYDYTTRKGGDIPL